MSESKFTPGPWSIVRYGDGSSLVIHSDEDNRVCFMATASSDRPSSHASIRANAALIAAAPELYEALCNLLGEYIKGADSGDWGNWDAYQQPEVIAARKALLKATPEQSDV